MKKLSVIACILLLAGCLGTKKMGLARPDFSAPRNTAPVNSSTAPVKSGSRLF